MCILTCEACERENRITTLVGTYLVENWKRFLDDCEILLNTIVMKLGDLLTILNP